MGEDDALGTGFGICPVKEDAAAVPAGIFGVVEGLVGAGEEWAREFAWSGLGEADADGERKFCAGAGELAYRLFDPGGDDEGVGRGGVGKDEEKFVAAEAAEGVIGAHTAGDGGDDVAEGGVAGCVSGVVVDGFEVVDVDEGYGQVVAAALGALEFGVESLLNATAVEDAGEQVPFRLIFDQGEEVAAEHEQEGEANEEGKGDAEQDGDGLQKISLCRVWRGGVDQQEDDAIQGEDGIGCHEKGEDLQEDPVG
ncbi:hypothetical protein RBB78_12585 [Tunturiibacter empetritectus]